MRPFSAAIAGLVAGLRFPVIGDRGDNGSVNDSKVPAGAVRAEIEFLEPPTNHSRAYSCGCGPRPREPRRN